jgi:endo-1,4-beta-D-glucanase Y
MIFRRPLFAFACLSFVLSSWACASAKNDGGTGGSSATGGSSSTGGSSATGGSTGTGGSATGSGGAGAGLGTGVGHAFPQNMKTGSCMLTTVSGASTQTQSAYNSWKSAYVVSGNPGLRVQRPENQNDTVSEGIGYGMLAAVYMGDKQTFDGLLQYQQAHLDSKGLMNWHITSGGATASDGSFSASDGDEDIAFAMLMASDQWSGTDYLTPGRAMIENIKAHSLFSDGTLQNGDNFNTADTLNIDYFSPAYYRVFQKAIPDGGIFQFTVSSGYKHLLAQAGTDGLVPDSSNLEDSSTCSTCKATYGYDACRTPWRIAVDYCWNNSSDAAMYLQKIGAFFAGVGASNIGDGYSLTGAKTSSNANLAFSGPAGVGAMSNLASNFQTLEDASFNLMVSPPGGNTAYFPQSLRVISMLMMSGNFLDYSQM